MSPRRLAAVLGLALAAARACAAAALGAWGTDLAEGRRLAEHYDRPLVVLVSNSSGKCDWCNVFDADVLADSGWSRLASEQRLALVRIDAATQNWSASYYSALMAAETSVTGFPAVAVYEPDGTNVIAAFTFRPAGSDKRGRTPAQVFCEQLEDILDGEGYWLDMQGTDVWDPVDNLNTGATELKMARNEQQQYHSVGAVRTEERPEDLHDWFTFAAAAKTPYLFRAQDVNNTVLRDGDPLFHLEQTNDCDRAAAAAMNTNWADVVAQDWRCATNEPVTEAVLLLACNSVTNEMWIAGSNNVAVYRADLTNVFTRVADFETGIVLTGEVLSDSVVTNQTGLTPGTGLAHAPVYSLTVTNIVGTESTAAIPTNALPAEVTGACSFFTHETCAIVAVTNLPPDRYGLGTNDVAAFRAYVFSTATNSVWGEASAQTSAWRFVKSTSAVSNNPAVFPVASAVTNDLRGAELSWEDLVDREASFCVYQPPAVIGKSARAEFDLITAEGDGATTNRVTECSLAQLESGGALVNVPTRASLFPLVSVLDTASADTARLEFREYREYGTQLVHRAGLTVSNQTRRVAGNVTTNALVGVFSNVVCTVSNVFREVSYRPQTSAAKAYFVATNLYVQVAEFVVSDAVRCRAYTNDVLYTRAGWETNRLVNTVEYTLLYSQWQPGTAGFAKSAVTVNDNQDRVSIPVTRTGGATGPVRLRFWTEDGADGADGAVGRAADDIPEDKAFDFFHQEGVIVWEDGKSATTNLVIDLVKDLFPTWKGDRSFTVHLARDTDAAPLQAALGITNITVTLKETTKKNAGTVRFVGWADEDGGAVTRFASASKTATTLAAGATRYAVVAREGGSDGEAMARVVSQKGTAKTDFPEIDEEINWEHGDSELAYIPVTIPDDAELGKTFVLKLTSQTKDVRAVSPSSITVTMRPDGWRAAVEDTRGAAANGVALACRDGGWHWNGTDAESAALSVAVAPGKSSSLQLTLTGPGVLRFATAGLSEDVKLECSGGVTRKQVFDADVADGCVLVKTGRQTVTFKVSAGKDAADVNDVTLDNLVWTALPTIDPLSVTPANGMVLNDSVDEGTISADPEPAMNVLIGADCAEVETDLEFEVDCVFVSPKTLPDEPRNGAVFTWRANVVWRAESDAEEAGDSVTRTGSTYTFTYTAADSLEDTFEDASLVLPEAFDVDGVYVIPQGYLLTPDPEMEANATNGVSYRVVGGKLPPGVTLNTKTGALKGTATKPGFYTFSIQRVEKGVVCEPVPFFVRVDAVADLAGTYTGWVTFAPSAAETNDAPYIGTAELSVAATGTWTLKTTVNGKTDTRKGTGWADCESGVGADDAVQWDAFALRLGNGTNDWLVVSPLAGTADTADDAEIMFKGADRLCALSLRKVTTTGWEAFKGYYTVALPVADLPDAEAAAEEDPFALTPRGTGYMTVTVDAKGKVKVAGMLADGTAISCATYLTRDETGDADAAEDVDNGSRAAEFFVFAQPAAYKAQGAFCGRFQLTMEESDAEWPGKPAVTVQPCEGSEVVWWNNCPTAYKEANDALPGYRLELDAAGAYYNSLLNLKTYYLGCSVTFRDDAESPAGTDEDTVKNATALWATDYDGGTGTSGLTLDTETVTNLPFGTALDVADDKLGVKNKRFNLTLAKATGLLSGSFLVDYTRENVNGKTTVKTKTAPCRGVFTPFLSEDAYYGRGVQASGFYTLPDTVRYIDTVGRIKTAAYNRSSPFCLVGDEIPEPEPDEGDSGETADDADAED